MFVSFYHWYGNIPQTSQTKPKVLLRDVRATPPETNLRFVIGGVRRLTNRRFVSQISRGQDVKKVVLKGDVWICLEMFGDVNEGSPFTDILTNIY